MTDHNKYTGVEGALTIQGDFHTYGDGSNASRAGFSVTYGSTAPGGSYRRHSHGRRNCGGGGGGIHAKANHEGK